MAGAQRTKKAEERGARFIYGRLVAVAQPQKDCPVGVEGQYYKLHLELTMACFCQMMAKSTVLGKSPGGLG
ncbi:hypothetical protein JRQ81_001408 [Phrynocephalus forsythii]|uniref:Uncharacterized protein n=1 Tax=Phrynocephalus forsythii TaxID=171643 RepID=A0A9Q0Y7W9_9SAUR|nr:hypothetical protein JRQ81_001408 [Phrynocephalus forsythii]